MFFHPRRQEKDKIANVLSDELRVESYDPCAADSCMASHRTLNILYTFHSCHARQSKQTFKERDKCSVNMIQNTVRHLVRRQIDLKTFDRSFSSQTLTDCLQLSLIISNQTLHRTLMASIYKKAQLSPPPHYQAN